jgi:hypothetical protein
MCVGSFFEQVKCVLDRFPKFHMKLLLFRDLIVKVGREGVFKPRTWNQSLLKISNDNGIRVLNFVISRSLSRACLILQHNLTLTSPNRMDHCWSDHNLIGDRNHVYLWYCHVVADVRRDWQ